MCILFADDEFLIRLAAQNSLENVGYEVLAAEHGKQAMQYLDLHPKRFTCLVSDYHMPHVCGDEVIEHYRKIYPLTSAILATAHHHATSSAWRYDHQVNLLLKPYSMDELTELVARLVT